MTWDSAARTILGIQQTGCDNIGVLLDFGHSLYGGESPADAAQLLIDHGLLWGMDVNDNLRGWDDDLMVGSVHLTEIFEYFYTLKINGWEGVWQLDQFPFREDTVETARASIRLLKALHRALDTLDIPALQAAQARQDAIGAQRLVQDALLSCMGGRPMTTTGRRGRRPRGPRRGPARPVCRCWAATPAGASPREIVAHLREGAKEIRKQDIQMIRAAGLGTSVASSRSSTSSSTLYLHSLERDAPDPGRP